MTISTNKFLFSEDEKLIYHMLYNLYYQMRWIIIFLFFCDFLRTEMHRKREMCSDHINKQFWWRSMSKCDEKSGSGSCVFSCCIINGLMKIPVISKYSAIQSSHCFLYTSHMVCFAHCFPLSVVHLHNDLCSQKKESKKNYINCKVSVCVYTTKKLCLWRSDSKNHLLYWTACIGFSICSQFQWKVGTSMGEIWKRRLCSFAFLSAFFFQFSICLSLTLGMYFL